MEFTSFSLNGELRPVDEARISLTNIEYQYGFGVYETIRVQHGKSLFLKDHIERLFASAKIIGLEHTFDDARVEKFISELLEKNAVDTCNLKILLIGASRKADAQLCMLCLNPLFPEKNLYRDGALCVTYEHERRFPNAKTLSMLGSYLAFKNAKEKGAYDALLVNAKGSIVEGTRTNLLAMRGRIIITPPEGEILLGVTRKYVLEIAGKIGLDVKTDNIKLEHVEEYENLFLTSTSSKIIPIRQVDEQKLNAPSPLLRELMAAFDAFLDSVQG